MVRLGIVIVMAVLLSACAINPETLSEVEQGELVAADRVKMFIEQEPITGAISLEEALDRALANNLDSRMMMVEEALSNDQLDLSRYDMLPQLTLNSGYTNRSNENLILSRDTATDVLTTNPFVSQDRAISYGNLGLTWNILDFGVSYYQAHQNADQMLIAQQRRRSVVNQIVQQVRSSYWRAATAEPLYERIVPILTQARQALNDARETESERLTPPLESLQYQKGLVEIIRELDSLELDLAIAKSELSSLMGMPPGMQFSLELPVDDEMGILELDWSLEEMELMALINRPELIEEHYQSRISANETRKAMLRMFPGITFGTAAYYDSNSYLLEQSWADVGVRLSWNILNLVSGRAAIRAADTGEELAELRRLATSMAAITQVHVSYHQFRRSTRSYEQALILDDIERRIFNNVNLAANNQGQSVLQRIRAELAAVYAEVNRYRAYSELQNAAANLYVSVGVDLLKAEPVTVVQLAPKSQTQALTLNKQ